MYDQQKTTADESFAVNTIMMRILKFLRSICTVLYIKKKNDNFTVFYKNSMTFLQFSIKTQ